MLLTYILTCFQLAAPDRVASLSFADRWMLMKEVSQKEVFQETHDQTFAFHMMMCHTVRPLVAMKDSDESDGWAFRSGDLYQSNDHQGRHGPLIALAFRDSLSFTNFWQSVLRSTT